MGRTISYPTIFLKRLKHKPNTYSIKEWCDHRKLKTATMWELSGLLPKMHLFHADGNVNWAKWKEFKAMYNINGALMRSLVKEHVSDLKLKEKKRSKKTETESEEL